jgi:hypothetical protein
MFKRFKTKIMEQNEENRVLEIKAMAERFINESYLKNITLESEFGTTNLKEFLVAFHKYIEIWAKNKK